MGSQPESISPPSRVAVASDDDDDDYGAASAAAACCSRDCHRRRPSPASWRRTVKRKLEEVEGDEGAGAGVAARVELGNEVAALREALAGHQQTVAVLCEELEEERAASASAASEAMSMILRLQREKAEAQMEARQFKRFADEKMAHDQQELVALDDLLYKREQALQALSCEVQAYRHRLLSYGIGPDSLDPTAEPAALDDGGVPESPSFDYPPAYEYPPLICYDNQNRFDPNIYYGDDDVDDLDEYPPGATPRSLQNIGQRIHHLERTQSRGSLVQEMEKGVVMGQSPRAIRASHARQVSVDYCSSPLAKEHMCNGKQREEFPATVDDDSTCDRVYTVDAVHKGAASQAPMTRACEVGHVGTPRGVGGGQEEVDIKELYMRLEALEADRESMRHALISMRTDKTQMVLLKEIAQHLYRDASSPPAQHLYRDASFPPAPALGKKLVKKPSLFGSLLLVSTVKWLLSFLFWRKQRRKQSLVLSCDNVGLLLLLEKAPQMQHRRCLSRIQG